MVFRNKLFAALVLLTFVVCSGCIDQSATDYSPTEDLGENVLEDPQFGLKIKTADVTISTSQVIIDYVSSSSSVKEIGNDTGAVLAVYKMIIDEHPEVGDLLILARSNFGSTPTRFTCSRTWVSEVDFNNAEAVGAVVGKVIETSKTG